MSSVLWFQAGACSGNTMSFLNAEEPNVVDLIVDFGLEVIWHPSLGVELGDNAKKIFSDCASGARPMDIFVLEGTVIRGPDGTGRMDMFAGRPMIEWVTELANAASIVVAIGDCACDGGVFQGSYAVVGKVAAVLPVDLQIPGCPPDPDALLRGLLRISGEQVNS